MKHHLAWNFEEISEKRSDCEPHIVFCRNAKTIILRTVHGHWPPLQAHTRVSFTRSTHHLAFQSQLFDAGTFGPLHALGSANPRRFTNEHVQRVLHQNLCPASVKGLTHVRLRLRFASLATELNTESTYLSLFVSCLLVSGRKRCRGRQRDVAVPFDVFAAVWRSILRKFMEDSAGSSLI